VLFRSVKHCGTAHGYFAKTNNPPGQNSPRPPAMRNRTSFYLLTTPMTRAARVCCTNTIKLKKLARKPFKLIDLSELNKEWSKESRNITDLVKASKAKTHPKRLLSKDLISVIAKTYQKLLKKKKRSDLKKVTNGTNGHHLDNHNQNSNTDIDDDEDDNELVIDNNDEIKGDEPEFLRYFEQKATTPCYTPAQLLYPKPSGEQMNKFYLNLITQNRKRPHENVNGELTKTNGDLNSDSSPISKRSLLNNQSKPLNSTVGAVKQSVRMAQKSTKPTQAINLNNCHSEFYYAVNNYLKSLRREIKIVSLRKLARKPSKIMSKYTTIYTKFSEIRKESLAKIRKTTSETVLNGNSKTNGQEKKLDLKSDDEIVDVEASDNSNELILKHKLNGTETKMGDKLDEDEQIEASTNDEKPEPVVVLD